MAVPRHSFYTKDNNQQGGHMAYKVQTIAGMTEEAAAVLNRKGIKYAE